MTLKLNGSSDGSVSLSAPADTSPSGTDVTLTLPTSDGDANQVLETNGSGVLSWATPVAGITHFGLFQLQSNKTSDGDLTDWGQNTTTRAAADIGSSMTHSSGVFTFPTTGKWLVVLKIYLQLTDDTVGGTIHATDDNGSNWSSVVGLAGGFHNDDTAGSGNNGDTGFYFMDVTDTSNDKVKFSIGSVGSSCLAEGGTTRNWTTCFFVRIGDT